MLAANDTSSQPPASLRATTSHLSTRLAEPGPKRLLALDGGGVRGLITLGYLARIEQMLRRRYGRENLVLRDYFDLIGGTSTGALIATALALGWTVAEVRDLYMKLGAKAFRPRKSVFGFVGRLLGARFAEQPLEALLRERLGERRLDSADLGVGLMVVLKRADTGSVWPVMNLPGQRFFKDNRGIMLWELMRASTAAPTFFRPRRLSDVGRGEEAVFVDGGVSMHNNPALQLLMVANLSGFSLRWPLVKDRILLCSVGTGRYTPTGDLAALEKAHNIHWAQLVIEQLLHDASELGETVLQWASRSSTARSIDRQIGALTDDDIARQPLLTYLRYNVTLDWGPLRELGVPLAPDLHLESLRDMSNVRHLALLDSIGKAAAARDVREGQFPIGLDRVAFPLSLCVGVTGHRAVESVGDGLRARVRELLETLRSVCEKESDGGEFPRRFCVVSPLAEGADRIVAEEGLALGYELRCPLPLSVTEYAEDFATPQSVTHYHALLERAVEVRLVENDASNHDGTRSAAYARVGSEVIRSSDLIFALWDGEPARGQGGTGRVVEEAVAAGRPVVWISTQPPHRVVLLGSQAGDGIDNPGPEELAAMIRGLD